MEAAALQGWTLKGLEPIERKFRRGFRCKLKAVNGDGEYLGRVLGGGKEGFSK